MRLGSKFPKRLGYVPAARSAPFCPACGHAWVDPGPPAQWGYCRRCPYKIAPPGREKVTDAGASDEHSIYDGHLSGLAGLVAMSRED